MFLKTLCTQILGLSLVLFTSTTPAAAHSIEIGDLVIDHPAMRIVAPGVKRSGGYLSIKNTGDTADRLINATANFSKKTELHTMEMDGDVMKMRALENGIEIPAGETIYLQPGGLHVMFIGLKESLVEGDFNPVELTFEKSGRVMTHFKVERVIERRDGDKVVKMDHSKHK